MSGSEPISVIIADDHPLFRDALTSLIDRDPGFRVAATAATLDEALAALGGQRADIALIDLHMPGMDGPAPIGRLRSAAPGTKIVIVSGDTGSSPVREAIAAGAHGYLPKTFRPDTLLAALRLILSGVDYVPSELTAVVLPEASAPAPATALSGKPLTPRELEVLTLLARGASHKEIARELDLVEVTIKLHTKRIVTKLKVKNRQAAIALAIRDGIVRLD